MSERQRYTAQEMRNSADNCDWRTHPCIAAMLRQAADAEDELRTMRSTWLTPETSKALFNDCVSKTKDLADLKSRLEAVVKIASDNSWCEDSGVVETDTCAKLHNSYMSDILRAARGEGGAE